MSRFEFNLVLVSIMLAFAATEQLAVWGRVLRTPARYGFSWPYLLSSLWVLLAIVMHWVMFWAYSDVDINQARYVLLLIVPSLVLALCSFALAPDPDTREPILENHWNESSGRLMLLFGTFPATACAVDIMLPGALAGPPPLLVVPLVAIFWGASFERFRRFRPAVLAFFVSIQALGLWNRSM